MRRSSWFAWGMVVLVLAVRTASPAAAAGWRPLAAGSDYTAAVKEDGSLWAWGANGVGQLGDGTAVNKSVPTRIGADAFAGWSHAVAIKTDGSLWGWGSNGSGELGDGSIGEGNVAPTQIGAGHDWADVAAGPDYTYAVKTDGSLWFWGFNFENRVPGVPPYTEVVVPIRVGAATDWASVAAGEASVAALKTDGSLWVHPGGPMGGDTDWAAVTKGVYHTAALKTDGTLWAWGANYSGQLGDGSRVNRAKPVRVGADADWATVAAGQDCTLAVKTDGSLWAWGNGPLGLGATLAVTPAQVVAPPQLAVSVTISPPEGGAVTGGARYYLGSAAALTATAAEGYRFAGWSGDASGAANPASVTVDGANAVTANLVKIFPVAATANPDLGGTVAGGGMYDQGASATLTVTAAEGYRFKGWSGDVTGAASPVTVTVAGPLSVTADFVKVFSVSAAANLEAGGTVTGGGTYDEGASVTLTAAPSPGYRFRGWTGEASGTANPLTLTVEATATVTAVFAPNEAPAFSPALSAKTVDEGALLTFPVSATDPDGDAVTLSARDLPPGATFEGGRFSWVPSLAQAGEYAVTFPAADPDVSAETTVAITVVHVPPPPVAAAGPDLTVEGGAAVVLDGSNSFDPEGSLASFEWTQTAGPPVVLPGASTATPSFIAPPGGTDGVALVFMLTVADGDGHRATDEVVVNVRGSANLPPTADAGPSQTVVQGAEVLLSGAGSADPESGELSYLWAQLSGPAAVLSDATAAEPTFTAPAPAGSGTALVFQLSVADPAGLEATDAVTVNVLAAVDAALPPVARAGDDLEGVDEGAAATLDGSASSDADGVIVLYRWAQLSGPAATLSKPGAVAPTFTTPSVPPAGADLSFELSVTDDRGLRASDRVTVHVGNVNVPPTADAGPDQAVTEGQTVTLSGSGADSDGVIRSRAWRQTSGSPVAFSGAGEAGPIFTAPPVGADGAVLEFELTVTDDLGASASDTVTIEVDDVPESGGGGGGGCFVRAAEVAEASSWAWLLAVSTSVLAARGRRGRRRGRPD